jgi:hypothetical protein
LKNLFFGKFSFLREENLDSRQLESSRHPLVRRQCQASFQLNLAQHRLLHRQLSARPASLVPEQEHLPYQALVAGVVPLARLVAHPSVVLAAESFLRHYHLLVVAWLVPVLHLQPSGHPLVLT